MKVTITKTPEGPRLQLPIPRLVRLLTLALRKGAVSLLCQGTVYRMSRLYTKLIACGAWDQKLALSFPTSRVWWLRLPPMATDRPPLKIAP